MKTEERIRQRIKFLLRHHMEGSGIADRLLAKAEALAWALEEDLDTIWDEVLDDMERSKDNEQR